MEGWMDGWDGMNVIGFGKNFVSCDTHGEPSVGIAALCWYVHVHDIWGGVVTQGGCIHSGQHCGVV